MKFGLFDHIELTEKPLATTFDERLAFAEAADRAGFYCLHLAEHHCTPLNSIPVPGVYMGALARLTRNIHFGPLVYLLPLYSPLRLAEEICILDHLSRGRLEIGVGRGVSPFELGFQNIAHEDSRDIFFEAYDCLVTALTNNPFTFKGKRYTYDEVPLPLRPLQQPLPPFWYGSSNTTGSTWAGEQGMHFVSNGPTQQALTNINAYREALARRGSPARPKAGFSGGAAVGVLRHVVVAESDREAEAIARPALEYHNGSLSWLRRKYGSSELTKRIGAHADEGYDSWQKLGMVIAGTPDTVADKLRSQIKELGINYLITYLFFGTMAASDAHRSLALYAREVMPKLADL
ncbi:MAG: hypothetical protein RLZ98_573 [Pseudomonadota bacterium]|jgi:alkanesulfonate monooxygenase SsuD/methylene tetrahydromethanopterin reductase-like flavin-dependent oxidoreductase (luciferase family)